VRLRRRCAACWGTSAAAGRHPVAVLATGGGGCTAADRNADGVLDPEELREWARRGAAQQFERVDSKGAGYVTFEEFKNGMSSVRLLQSNKPGHDVRKGR
jgi:hypothetical protein